MLHCEQKNNAIHVLFYNNYVSLYLKTTIKNIYDIFIMYGACKKVGLMEQFKTSFRNV